MIRRYRRFSLIILAVLGLYCSTQVTGTTDETETGNRIYGRLIDYNDKKPVSNALVRLFAVTDTDTIINSDNPVAPPLDSTITDENGEYFFDNVTAGDYHLEAWYALNDDTLQSFHAHIRHKADTLAGSDTYAGIDTLKTPGSISGRVLFEESDLSEVIVYIPGTSFYARTVSTGQFSFNQVPNGVYTIVYRRSGYRKEADSSVTVRSGETTFLSEKVLLPLNTLPPPEGVNALFNRTSMVVSVFWNPVVTDSISGYRVARRDSLSSDSVSHSTQIMVADTLYNDTISPARFSQSDTVVIDYKVQTVGTGGSTSLWSPAVYVTVTVGAIVTAD
jgi:hypothetical protein